MVIFNGSDYELSLVHILENMVPEAVSAAEMILHQMTCCRVVMRWDGRRRLIVDGHRLPGTDLAELLEFGTLPYHKHIPKPRDLDTFTKGIAGIGTEPRHMWNECIPLVVEAGKNAQNALESEYDSKKQFDADSLTAEPDLEPRVFPS